MVNILNVLLNGGITFTYPGTWKGRFTGTDTGTWTAELSTDGIITGTGYSSDLGGPFTFSGLVDKYNNFVAEAFSGGVSTGAVYSRVVSAPDIVDGTWESNVDPGEQGTFTGSLQ